ncbi:hypothetical protein TGMAS_264140 [Toxoplasma gondii MAS]|uniref:Uncharacterized protein n=1 Tax=Toxoplasma gondii MAS TaxID=943118 RepID=A0A086QN46_TOXGO|nr:hypothetical protein TGMAS_264140 [Toxoplasma gondii MAS]
MFATGTDPRKGERPPNGLLPEDGISIQPSPSSTAGATLVYPLSSKRSTHHTSPSSTAKPRLAVSTLSRVFVAPSPSRPPKAVMYVPVVKPTHTAVSSEVQKHCDRVSHPKDDLSVTAKISAVGTSSTGGTPGRPTSSGRLPQQHQTGGTAYPSNRGKKHGQQKRTFQDKQLCKKWNTVSPATYLASPKTAGNAHPTGSSPGGTDSIAFVGNMVTSAEVDAPPSISDAAETETISLQTTSCDHVLHPPVDTGNEKENPKEVSVSTATCKRGNPSEASGLHTTAATLSKRNAKNASVGTRSQDSLLYEVASQQRAVTATLEAVPSPAAWLADHRERDPTVPSSTTESAVICSSPLTTVASMQVPNTVEPSEFATRQVNSQKRSGKEPVLSSVERPPSLVDRKPAEASASQKTMPSSSSKHSAPIPILLPQRRNSSGGQPFGKSTSKRIEGGKVSIVWKAATNQKADSNNQSISPTSSTVIKRIIGEETDGRKSTATTQSQLQGDLLSRVPPEISGDVPHVTCATVDSFFLTRHRQSTSADSVPQQKEAGNTTNAKSEGKGRKNLPGNNMHETKGGSLHNRAHAQFESHHSASIERRQTRPPERKTRSPSVGTARESGWIAQPERSVPSVDKDASFPSEPLDLTEKTTCPEEGFNSRVKQEAPLPSKDVSRCVETSRGNAWCAGEQRKLPVASASPRVNRKHEGRVAKEGAASGDDPAIDIEEGSKKGNVSPAKASVVLNKEPSSFSNTEVTSSVLPNAAIRPSDDASSTETTVGKLSRLPTFGVTKHDSPSSLGPKASGTSSSTYPSPRHVFRSLGRGSSHMPHHRRPPTKQYVYAAVLKKPPSEPLGQNQTSSTTAWQALSDKLSFPSCGSAKQGHHFHGHEDDRSVSTPTLATGASLPEPGPLLKTPTPRHHLTLSGGAFHTISPSSPRDLVSRKPVPPPLIAQSPLFLAELREDVHTPHHALIQRTPSVTDNNDQQGSLGGRDMKGKQCEHPQLGMLPPSPAPAERSCSLAAEKETNERTEREKGRQPESTLQALKGSVNRSSYSTLRWPVETNGLAGSDLSMPHDRRGETTEDSAADGYATERKKRGDFGYGGYGPEKKSGRKEGDICDGQAVHRTPLEQRGLLSSASPLSLAAHSQQATLRNLLSDSFFGAGSPPCQKTPSCNCLRCITANAALQLTAHRPSKLLASLLATPIYSSLLLGPPHSATAPRNRPDNSGVSGTASDGQTSGTPAVPKSSTWAKPPGPPCSLPVAPAPPVAGRDRYAGTLRLPRVTRESDGQLSLASWPSSAPPPVRLNPADSKDSSSASCTEPRRDMQEPGNTQSDSGTLDAETVSSNHQYYHDPSSLSYKIGAPLSSHGSTSSASGSMQQRDDGGRAQSQCPKHLRSSFPYLLDAPYANEDEPKCENQRETVGACLLLNRETREGTPEACLKKSPRQPYLIVKQKVSGKGTFQRESNEDESADSRKREASTFHEKALSLDSSISCLGATSPSTPPEELVGSLRKPDKESFSTKDTRVREEEQGTYCREVERSEKSNGFSLKRYTPKEAGPETMSITVAARKAATGQESEGKDTPIGEQRDFRSVRFASLLRQHGHKVSAADIDQLSLHTLQDRHNSVCAPRRPSQVRSEPEVTKQPKVSSEKGTPVAEKATTKATPAKNLRGGCDDSGVENARGEAQTGPEELRQRCGTSGNGGQERPSDKDDGGGATTAGHAGKKSFLSLATSACSAEIHRVADRRHLFQEPRAAEGGKGLVARLASPTQGEEALLFQAKLHGSNSESKKRTDGTETKNQDWNIYSLQTANSRDCSGRRPAEPHGMRLNDAVKRCSLSPSCFLVPPSEKNLSDLNLVGGVSDKRRREHQSRNSEKRQDKGTQHGEILATSPSPSLHPCALSHPPTAVGEDRNSDARHKNLRSCAQGTARTPENAAFLEHTRHGQGQAGASLEEVEACLRRPSASVSLHTFATPDSPTNNEWQERPQNENFTAMVPPGSEARTRSFPECQGTQAGRKIDLPGQGCISACTSSTGPHTPLHDPEPRRGAARQPKQSQQSHAREASLGCHPGVSTVPALFARDASSFHSTQLTVARTNADHVPPLDPSEITKHSGAKREYRDRGSGRDELLHLLQQHSSACPRDDSQGCVLGPSVPSPGAVPSRRHAPVPSIEEIQTEIPSKSHSEAEALPGGRESQQPRQRSCLPYGGMLLFGKPFPLSHAGVAVNRTGQLLSDSEMAGEGTVFKQGEPADAQRQEISPSEMCAARNARENSTGRDTALQALTGVLQRLLASSSNPLHSQPSAHVRETPIQLSSSSSEADSGPLLEGSSRGSSVIGVAPLSRSLSESKPSRLSTGDLRGALNAVPQSSSPDAAIDETKSKKGVSPSSLSRPSWPLSSSGVAASSPSQAQDQQHLQKKLRQAMHQSQVPQLVLGEKRLDERGRVPLSRVERLLRGSGDLPGGQARRPGTAEATDRGEGGASQRAIGGSNSHETKAYGQQGQEKKQALVDAVCRELRRLRRQLVEHQKSKRTTEKQQGVEKREGRDAADRGQMKAGALESGKTRVPSPQESSGRDPGQKPRSALHPPGFPPSSGVHSPKDLPRSASSPGGLVKAHDTKHSIGGRAKSRHTASASTELGILRLLAASAAAAMKAEGGLREALSSASLSASLQAVLLHHKAKTKEHKEERRASCLSRESGACLDRGPSTSSRERTKTNAGNKLKERERGDGSGSGGQPPTHAVRAGVVEPRSATGPPDMQKPAEESSSKASSLLTTTSLSASLSKSGAMAVRPSSLPSGALILTDNQRHQLRLLRKLHDLHRAEVERSRRRQVEELEGPEDASRRAGTRGETGAAEASEKGLRSVSVLADRLSHCSHYRRRDWCGEALGQPVLSGQFPSKEETAGVCPFDGTGPPPSAQSSLLRQQSSPPYMPSLGPASPRPVDAGGVHARVPAPVSRTSSGSSLLSRLTANFSGPSVSVASAAAGLGRGNDGLRKRGASSCQKLIFDRSVSTAASIQALAKYYLGQKALSVPLASSGPPSTATGLHRQKGMALSHLSPSLTGTQRGSLLGRTASAGSFARVPDPPPSSVEDSRVRNSRRGSEATLAHAEDRRERQAPFQHFNRGGGDTSGFGLAAEESSFLSRHHMSTRPFPEGAHAELHQQSPTPSQYQTRARSREATSEIEESRGENSVPRYALQGRLAEARPERSLSPSGMAAFLSVASQGHLGAAAPSTRRQPTLRALSALDRGSSLRTEVPSANSVPPRRFLEAPNDSSSAQTLQPRGGSGDSSGGSRGAAVPCFREVSQHQVPVLYDDFCGRQKLTEGLYRVQRRASASKGREGEAAPALAGGPLSSEVLRAGESRHAGEFKHQDSKRSREIPRGFLSSADNEWNFPDTKGPLAAAAHSQVTTAPFGSHRGSPAHDQETTKGYVGTMKQPRVEWDEASDGGEETEEDVSTRRQALRAFLPEPLRSLHPESICLRVCASNEGRTEADGHVRDQNISTLLLLDIPLSIIVPGFFHPWSEANGLDLLVSKFLLASSEATGRALPFRTTSYPVSSSAASSSRRDLEESFSSFSPLEGADSISGDPSVPDREGNASFSSSWWTFPNCHQGNGAHSLAHHAASFPSSPLPHASHGHHNGCAPALFGPSQPAGHPAAGNVSALAFGGTSASVAYAFPPLFRTCAAGGGGGVRGAPPGTLPPPLLPPPGFTEQQLLLLQHQHTPPSHVRSGCHYTSSQLVALHPAALAASSPQPYPRIHSLPPVALSHVHHFSGHLLAGQGPSNLSRGGDNGLALAGQPHPSFSTPSHLPPSHALHSALGSSDALFSFRALATSHPLSGQQVPSAWGPSPRGHYPSSAMGTATAAASFIASSTACQREAIHQQQLHSSQASSRFTIAKKAKADTVKRDLDEGARPSSGVDGKGGLTPSEAEGGTARSPAWWDTAAAAFMERNVKSGTLGGPDTGGAQSRSLSTSADARSGLRGSRASPSVSAGVSHFSSFGASSRPDMPREKGVREGNSTRGQEAAFADAPLSGPKSGALSLHAALHDGSHSPGGAVGSASIGGGGKDRDASVSWSLSNSGPAYASRLHSYPLFTPPSFSGNSFDGSVTVASYRSNLTPYQETPRISCLAESDRAFASSSGCTFPAGRGAVVDCVEPQFERSDAASTAAAAAADMVLACNSCLRGIDTPSKTLVYIDVQSLQILSRPPQLFFLQQEILATVLRKGLQAFIAKYEEELQMKMQRHIRRCRLRQLMRSYGRQPGASVERLEANGGEGRELGRAGRDEPVNTKPEDERYEQPGDEEVKQGQGSDVGHAHGETDSGNVLETSVKMQATVRASTDIHRIQRYTEDTGAMKTEVLAVKTNGIQADRAAASEWPQSAHRWNTQVRHAVAEMDLNTPNIRTDNENKAENSLEKRGQTEVTTRAEKGAECSVKAERERLALIVACTDEKSGHPSNSLGRMRSSSAPSRQLGYVEATCQSPTFFGRSPSSEFPSHRLAPPPSPSPPFPMLLSCSASSFAPVSGPTSYSDESERKLHSSTNLHKPLHTAMSLRDAARKVQAGCVQSRKSEQDRETEAVRVELHFLSAESHGKCHSEKEENAGSSGSSLQDGTTSSFSPWLHATTCYTDTLVGWPETETPSPSTSWFGVQENRLSEQQLLALLHTEETKGSELRARLMEAQRSLLGGPAGEETGDVERRKLEAWWSCCPSQTSFPSPQLSPCDCAAPLSPRRRGPSVLRALADRQEVADYAPSFSVVSSASRLSTRAQSGDTELHLEEDKGSNSPESRRLITHSGIERTAATEKKLSFSDEGSVGTGEGLTKDPLTLTDLLEQVVEQQKAVQAQIESQQKLLHTWRAAIEERAKEKQIEEAMQFLSLTREEASRLILHTDQGLALYEAFCAQARAFSQTEHAGPLNCRWRDAIRGQQGGEENWRRNGNEVRGDDREPRRNGKGNNHGEKHFFHARKEDIGTTHDLLGARRPEASEKAPMSSQELRTEDSKKLENETKEARKDRERGDGSYADGNFMRVDTPATVQGRDREVACEQAVHQDMEQAPTTGEVKAAAKAQEEEAAVLQSPRERFSLSTSVEKITDRKDHLNIKVSSYISPPLEPNVQAVKGAARLAEDFSPKQSLSYLVPAFREREEKLAELENAWLLSWKRTWQKHWEKMTPASGWHVVERGNLFSASQSEAAELAFFVDEEEGRERSAELQWRGRKYAREWNGRESGSVETGITHKSIDQERGGKLEEWSHKLSEEGQRTRPENSGSVRNQRETLGDELLAKKKSSSTSSDTFQEPSAKPNANKPGPSSPQASQSGRMPNDGDKRGQLPSIIDDSWLTEEDNDASPALWWLVPKGAYCCRCGRTQREMALSCLGDIVALPRSLREEAWKRAKEAEATADAAASLSSVFAGSPLRHGSSTVLERDMARTRSLEDRSFAQMMPHYLSGACEGLTYRRTFRGGDPTAEESEGGRTSHGQSPHSQTQRDRADRSEEHGQTPGFADTNERRSRGAEWGTSGHQTEVSSSQLPPVASLNVQPPQHVSETKRGKFPPVPVDRVGYREETGIGFDRDGQGHRTSIPSDENDTGSMFLSRGPGSSWAHESSKDEFGENCKSKDLALTRQIKSSPPSPPYLKAVSSQSRHSTTGVQNCYGFSESRPAIYTSSSSLPATPGGNTTDCDKGRSANKEDLRAFNHDQKKQFVDIVQSWVPGTPRVDVQSDSPSSDKVSRLSEAYTFNLHRASWELQRTDEHRDLPQDGFIIQENSQVRGGDRTGGNLSEAELRRTDSSADRFYCQCHMQPENADNGVISSGGAAVHSPLSTSSTSSWNPGSPLASEADTLDTHTFRAAAEVNLAPPSATSLCDTRIKSSQENNRRTEERQMSQDAASHGQSESQQKILDTNGLFCLSESPPKNRRMNRWSPEFAVHTESQITTAEESLRRVSVKAKAQETASQQRISLLAVGRMARHLELVNEDTFAVFAHIIMILPSRVLVVVAPPLFEFLFALRDVWCRDLLLLPPKGQPSLMLNQSQHQLQQELQKHQAYREAVLQPIVSQRLRQLLALALRKFYSYRRHRKAGQSYMLEDPVYGRGAKCLTRRSVSATAAVP